MLLVVEKISPPTLAGAAHPFLDNSCLALAKQIAHDLAGSLSSSHLIISFSVIHHQLADLL
jgi:hypothetical protein